LIVTVSSPKPLFSAEHMELLELRRWVEGTRAGRRLDCSICCGHTWPNCCTYPVGQRVGSVRNKDRALLDPLVLAA
jgi:hypothetical protein